MTPIGIRLARWIRLLLSSWRSRTNWLIRNASISWIEEILLTPMTRRTTKTLQMSDDEEFDSPAPSGDETSYQLSYSRSTRDEPSTSQAARKFYARKSTGRGPHQGSTTTMQPPSQNVNASSQQGSGRRKKTKPRRNYNVLYLREVKRLQKSTDLLIPKKCFGRLVREIMLKTSDEVTKITLDAMLALQESTEAYITQVLNDAFLLTQHRQRVTLSVSDIHILRVLKLIN